MFVPTVATINDLSGLGRCSLTVALPILSVLGVQSCPVPTAILSCHTGFDSFYFKELTSSLPKYIESFSSKSVKFDAIYTGFLGSYEQIKITEEFIKSQKNKPICIVDPVMGDHGEIYSTYTQQMCEEMVRLVEISDYITPNVTEACYLSKTEYTGNNITEKKAEEIAKRLVNIGAKTVIITGIRDDKNITNFIYNENISKSIKSNLSSTMFSGTGDIFASVMTGLLVRGKSLEYSVETASKFVFEAIEQTVKDGTDSVYGIQFETQLYKLCDIFR